MNYKYVIYLPSRKMFLHDCEAHGHLCLTYNAVEAEALLFDDQRKAEDVLLAVKRNFPDAKVVPYRT